MEPRRHFVADWLQQARTRREPGAGAIQTQFSLQYQRTSLHEVFVPTLLLRQILRQFMKIACHVDLHVLNGALACVLVTGVYHKTDVIV